MNNLTSSVIICTRNRINDLCNTLDSLSKQSCQPDQLVIVDSSDEPVKSNQLFTMCWDQETFPQTDLIYCVTKPGLTYQRNRGIEQATGEIIYFFDDDVLLEPDYLAVMQDTFYNNPAYAGGMGSITNMPQKDVGFWRVLKHIFLLHRDYSHGFFTASGMPTHAYGLKTFKNVCVLGGCCMAFRASVLKKHGFDENLSGYAYMEDCDISCRVSRDAPLFYNPAAQLKHLNSPLARDKIVDNRAMFIKNYRYLFFKNIYPHNRLKIVAHWWSILGLFLEALLQRNGRYLRGYIKGLQR